MCSRPLSPVRALTLRVATRIVAAAACLVAVSLGAQDRPSTSIGPTELAALEDSLTALRARAAEARVALTAAETRAREIPDDSLVFAGATVLFKAADFPPAERARLGRGFARVADHLRLTLGEAGPGLLAETRWQVKVVWRGGLFGRPFAQFAPVSNRWSAHTALRFPINEDMVENIVRAEVGAQIAARHPQLSAWLGGTLFLTDAASSYYLASRALVVHGNQRSRHCLRGSIEDCAIILDPSRRQEWYSDTIESRTFPPASPVVRSSLVHFAIATGGLSLLATLDTTSDSTPAVPLLAQSVGMTPDQFLTQWHAAVSGGGQQRAAVAPRLMLSSVAWTVLLGFLATRRRAR